ncbi:MAG: DUF1104 domain-containing protein [Desulfurivibrionaceae bacterium]
MKKTTLFRLTTILAGSLLTATMAWAATDYHAMSNEELAAKRGSMKEATVEERNAFQNEWQSRVQKMSPEERQKAVGQPENAPRDSSAQQSGQKQGTGGKSPGAGGAMNGEMGSGSGMGGRGGMGGGGRR